MKIDQLPVDRMSAAENRIARQGSRSVETIQPVVKKSSGNEEMQKTMQDRSRDKSREREASLEALKEAIDQANKSFRPMNRRFEYSVHEALQRVSVKVIDSSSDQVIREIPPEKLLDMVANMLEVAGIIVDERG